MAKVFFYILLELPSYEWHLILVQEVNSPPNQAFNLRSPLLDTHTPGLWLHLQGELLYLEVFAISTNTNGYLLS